MKMTDRFQDALGFAFMLHKNHFRKETPVPYFTHLMVVAATVIEYGGSEDEAIAALLHDAVEDQGGSNTLAIIKNCFGETVAEIVSGCSDSDTTPKPPWKERKEKHLAKLQTASPSILLVSIADKLHNASSVLRDYRQFGENIWSRFNGGKSGTLWHHGELLKIFKQRGLYQLLTRQYEAVIGDLFFIVENSGEDSSAGIDIFPPA